MSIKLRPSVQRFAEEMERVLRENDHKSGWDDLTNDHLIDRMAEEYEELHNEMYHRHGERTHDEPSIGRAVHEAIDLANFAMMFFDNNRDHYQKLDMGDFM